jgi:hypothetical protein
MTREITHIKAFTATSDRMARTFPIGRIPTSQILFVNTGEWNRAANQKGTKQTSFWI